MRAAYPDREGIVERDGAKIAFEVYECAGAPTLLLTQTWQVLHSRHWKLMKTLSAPSGEVTVPVLYP